MATPATQFRWSEESYSAPNIATAFGQANLPKYLLLTEGYFGQSDSTSIDAAEVLRVQALVIQRRVKANLVLPGGKLSPSVAIPLSSPVRVVHLAPRRHNPDHVYETVAELAGDFPVRAKVNRIKSRYKKKINLKRGSIIDLIKLDKRLDMDEKFGFHYVLICKYKDETLELPMDYRGDFTFEFDPHEYTVREVVTKYPFKRRLSFVDEIKLLPLSRELRRELTRCGYLNEVIVNRIYDQKLYVCTFETADTKGDNRAFGRDEVLFIPVDEKGQDTNFRVPVDPVPTPPVETALRSDHIKKLMERIPIDHISQDLTLVHAGDMLRFYRKPTKKFLTLPTPTESNMVFGSIEEAGINPREQWPSLPDVSCSRRSTRKSRPKVPPRSSSLPQVCNTQGGSPGDSGSASEGSPVGADIPLKRLSYIEFCKRLMEDDCDAIEPDSREVSSEKQEEDTISAQYDYVSARGFVPQIKINASPPSPTHDRPAVYESQTNSTATDKNSIDDRRPVPLPRKHRDVDTSSVIRRQRSRGSSSGSLSSSEKAATDIGSEAIRESIILVHTRDKLTCTDPQIRGHRHCSVFSEDENGSQIEIIRPKPLENKSIKHRKDITSLSQVPLSLEELTVDGLAECLRLIKLDAVAEKFQQNMVDGDMFLHLTDTALMGEPLSINLFEVQKLLRFREGWRPKC